MEDSDKCDKYEKNNFPLNIIGGCTRLLIWEDRFESYRGNKLII